MALASTFTTYLRERSPENAKQLAHELASVAGYALEAEALQHFQENGPGFFVVERGPWAGHRCWTAPDPPPEPNAGDIWLDSVEVMPMILTPGEPPAPDESYTPEALARFTPFEAWMALRPTANWQFAAFLELAPCTRRQLQINPPLPLFDPARILRGPETKAVTSVLADEAILYANWFGKVLCGRYEWLALRNLLPPDRFIPVWSSPPREWDGRFSEGVNAVVSLDTLDLDWTDEFDREIDGSAPQRIFYGEWEATPDVTFRTAVRWDEGLLRHPVDDSESPLDVQISRLAPR